MLKIAKLLSPSMFASKVLYMLGNLGMIWDMLYSRHLYNRYDKIWQALRLFFGFISFSWLLGIFMIIVNIAKIELADATEHCLLNSVSVRLFLPTELFCIPPILIWSSFLVGKKTSNSFFCQSVSVELFR